MLANPPATPVPESVPVTNLSTRFKWLIAVVGTLVLMALVITIQYTSRSSPKGARTWLSVLPPPYGFGLDPFPALSPDGTQLAFTAPNASGVPVLWIRPLDAFAAQSLAGTEDASQPFWSPDGRSVSFFAERKLKRVDVAGGSPHALAAAPEPRGGTWNRDGVIVFVPSAGHVRSGGVMPKWRSDGLELYYIAADGKLMCVDVTSRESSLIASAPRALFQAPRTLKDSVRTQYAPNSTGDRFLFNTPIEDPSPQAIMIGMNWSSNLKR